MLGSAQSSGENDCPMLPWRNINNNHKHVYNNNIKTHRCILMLLERKPSDCQLSFQHVAFFLAQLRCQQQHCNNKFILLLLLEGKLANTSFPCSTSTSAILITTSDQYVHTYASGNAKRKAIDHLLSFQQNTRRKPQHSFQVHAYAFGKESQRLLASFQDKHKHVSNKNIKTIGSYL